MISPSDKIIRDFLLGFIKIHILYHASQGEVYGSELMRELARHGYKIGPSTIYPILYRLTQEGYLKSEIRVEGGRMRKYYRITAQGEKALEQCKEKISQLVEEVL